VAQEICDINHVDISAFGERLEDWKEIEQAFNHG